ncbi:MFS transporter [Frigoribacterium faeni]|uniref:Lysosomal dipeptide transporter MFSD1 n=1 Tax=Frigoribacterium faeni TaxID=145483 RepID=A0A7W3JHA6_9MICO|nr:MFS transporter [Frigoribacterium faeni]MBA8812779.1 MFS family permease [Frigoribacterium faeni]BFF13902.1 MFS transporter [Microbacterium flavescens]GEK82405.1 MFS transporter [Frigoribacterium faeni]
MNSSRAWLVWGAAVFAYVVAVLQRSSLGVSGVEARHLFDVSASTLSTLAVVQLVVYAGLQIPVGVMLDRVGPKALIVTGGVLLALGQFVVAFSPPVIGVAIVGRVFVGAGDAMTFISVIRLLPSWFRGPILPQVSQWTGNVGQLGQILSAVPLSLILHGSGWSPAFVSAASLSVVAVVVVVLVVSESPEGRTASAGTATWRAAGRQLVESARRPGTRLGFWSHFVTQSSGTVFSLLWGVPFLVGGLGFSSAGASGMLAVLVASGVVAGPILGLLVARFPLRRSNLVLGIVSGMGLTWAVVLAWPGTPPVWLAVVLVVVIGVGGPGSIIGFDFARTFNPLRSLGVANGIVNVGGFLASFVMMFLIGVVLDQLDAARIASGRPSDIFSFESFRVAFLVQYLVVGAGVVGLIVERRRTRYGLHREEGIEVAPIWVALARRWRSTRGGSD